MVRIRLSRLDLWLCHLPSHLTLRNCWISRFCWTYFRIILRSRWVTIALSKAVCEHCKQGLEHSKCSLNVSCCCCCCVVIIRHVLSLISLVWITRVITTFWHSLNAIVGPGQPKNRSCLGSFDFFIVKSSLEKERKKNLFFHEKGFRRLFVYRLKATITPQKEAVDYLDTNLAHQSWDKMLLADTESPY